MVPHGQHGDALMYWSALLMNFVGSFVGGAATTYVMTKIRLRKGIWR